MLDFINGQIHVGSIINTIITFYVILPKSHQTKYAEMLTLQSIKYHLYSLTHTAGSINIFKPCMAMISRVDNNTCQCHGLSAVLHMRCKTKTLFTLRMLQS